MKPSATKLFQSARTSGRARGGRLDHQAIARKNGAEKSIRSMSSVSASIGYHA